MKMQYFFFFLAATLAASTAWGRASGSGLTGYSGAGSERTCTACHPNSGGTGSVTITPDSTTWKAGQQVHLHVTVADATAKRWGFELSPRKNTSATTAYGTLAVSNAYSQILSSGTLQYAVQTSTGTLTGTTGTASYDLVWTAPSDVTGGAVTFYAVGMGADSNNSDNGDHTYTATLTLQPDTSTTTGVTGTAMSLPQFVYGGGWATTLYFGNTTTTATAVALKFIAEDGSALNVAAAGGSSVTLNLAARGTAALEATDTGTLQSGWVQVTVPTGVTGYAVFRQTQSDGTKQEAVVPLAGTTAATTTLLFDETSFITAAAVLNPSTVSATVTITARGEAGTTLGTATLTLAAGAKTAVALRDVAGLSAMIGQRGSLDFTVTAGAVSVLGLRFSDSAFTSIPALER